MKKLSFIWYAAIAAALFSFALGFVSLRFYSQRHELVEFYEKEAIGILLLNEITAEVLRVSTSLEKNEKSSRQLLEKLNHDIFIKKVFGALNETEISGFRGQLGYSTQEWEGFRNLEDLNRYRSFILDKSNLILDPQFQAYHLIEALFVSLPKIFFLNRSLVQIQQDLQGGSLRYANDVKIWQEIGIKKTFLQNFSESLDKVFEFQPGDSGLEQHRVLLLSQKAEMIKNANRIFENLTYDAGRDVSDQVPLMGQQGLQILEEGVEGLRSLHEARLFSAKLGVYSSLIITFVLWVLSLVLVYFLVRAFLNTSKVMEDVISDQKKALAAAQKLAVLGELSAGIGHDIANPLTVIQATTSVLEKYFGKDQPGILPYLERIYRMVERINAIIKSMKSFLTNEEGGPIGEVDLRAAFNDVKLLINHRIKYYNIEMDLHIPENLHHIVGNESEIIQLFVNLISNAVDAVKDRQDPKIDINVVERDAYVFIQIKDNGPGIPEENREKIFEPLFTTKKKGEGTGLGLAICRRIIMKCHGKLELLDQRFGACFQVRLNISEAH